MLYRAIVVLVLLVALAFAFGCAPGVERTVDPSSGNFFTEEEYQKLSGDQREAYCAQLLSAYGSGQDCVSEARDGLDRESTAIADLEAELEGLQPRLMSIKGEVESLQGEIAYFEGLPRVYTVVKGDFLYKISETDEIYADPLKWKRIWRANKGAIEGFTDPNLIYPGWELTIPRDWPHTHTVKAGENLWQIARYWEVYGQGNMWSSIVEANRDLIKDPNVIQPGWVLTIPR